jgi:hypothetical protein
MKVSYTRTGGFAPIPVSCTLDTETSTPDEARELERLIAVSGIMQAQSLTNPAARDVRLHSIKITDDKTQSSKEVEWDDITIPPEARPLIQFLQARAKTMFNDDEG